MQLTMRSPKGLSNLRAHPFVEISQFSKQTQGVKDGCGGDSEIYWGPAVLGD